MPRKSKASKAKKRPAQSGRGLLDGLRKLTSIVGVKPSDLVQNIAVKKGGLVGTLGHLGSSLLRQHGFGSFRVGSMVRVPVPPQVGKGFWSDFAGGFEKGFLAPFHLAGKALGAIQGGGAGIIQTGDGFFDSLLKHAKTVSNITGIKPSSLLAGASAKKGGLVGHLGNLAASQLHSRFGLGQAGGCGLMYPNAPDASNRGQKLAM